MRLLDDGANFNLNGTRDGTAPGGIVASYDFDVDLRTILGNDLYDKHEVFGICLNSISLYMLISSYGVQGITGITFGSTTALKLRMTGLPFLASSLNGNLTSSTSGVLFPDIFTPGGSNIANNAYRVTNFANTKTKCIMFRKPLRSNVTINLSLRAILGTNSDFVVNNSGAPPQSTIDCSFTIFPAIETE